MRPRHHAACWLAFVGLTAGLLADPATTLVVAGYAAAAWIGLVAAASLLGLLFIDRPTLRKANAAPDAEADAPDNATLDTEA